MSPIKKLIDKITGQEEKVSQEMLLRAYGKLPSSREFLQLEAWQGQAKYLRDWIKAGHDGWVTRLAPEKRGKIAPYSLFLQPDEFKQHAMIASIFASQDCASPPRAFPFTLFVVQELKAESSWLELLIQCSHFWRQFEELFAPAYQQEITLTELAEKALEPLDDLAARTKAVVGQAENIKFTDWLNSVANSLQISDSGLCLSWFTSLVTSWQERQSEAGFAVRLPLSRSFPYLPQVAAWLRWFELHVDGQLDQLNGLVVPQRRPETEPALTILTGALSPDDFQLVTSNAQEYTYVEDGTCPGRVPPVSASARDRLGTLLSDRNLSLWGWAESSASQSSPPRSGQ